MITHAEVKALHASLLQVYRAAEHNVHAIHTRRVYDHITEIGLLVDATKAEDGSWMAGVKPGVPPSAAVAWMAGVHTAVPPNPAPMSIFNEGR